MAIKPRTKKSKYLHDNADWIMNLEKSGVSRPDITTRFNKEIRKKGQPFIINQDTHNFINAETERRARASVHFNPMMTNLWNAEGMRAAL